MLWTTLFSSLMYISSFFLGLIPAIPVTPSFILQIGDWVTSQLFYGVRLLMYVYTPGLFTLILVLLALFIWFDWWWALSWWVLRKIPFVGSMISK